MCVCKEVRHLVFTEVPALIIITVCERMLVCACVDTSKQSQEDLRFRSSLTTYLF